MEADTNCSIENNVALLYDANYKQLYLMWNIAFIAIKSILKPVRIFSSMGFKLKFIKMYKKVRKIQEIVFQIKKRN